MTITAEQLAKAAEYDAMAADCHREFVNSIDNCDADGFASQAGLKRDARQYKDIANFYRGGELITEVLLVDLEGKIISFRQCKNQYGESWILTDEAAKRFGRRFMTTSCAGTSAKRKQNNAKKGVAEIFVRVRGEYKRIDGHDHFIVNRSDLDSGNYEVLESKH